jgi:hypothetical protein
MIARSQARTTSWAKLLLVVLLVPLGACGTTRTVSLGGSVAQAGITASSGALSAYDTLDSLAEVERDRARMGNILTFPPGADPWDVSPPRREFAEALAVRRAAFSSMRATYAQFNRLSDPAFASQAEAAGKELSAALNGFAKAANTPLFSEQAVAQIPGLAQLATQQFQAGAIKQHNAVLAELASAAKTLWDADLPYWDRYIDTVFDSLVNQVRSLPDSAFDKAALARSVPEPYADYIRIRLLKERFATEADANKAQIRQQLGAVGQALAALELASTELAKDQPSLSDAAYWIGQVQGLLGHSQ